MLDLEAVFRSLKSELGLRPIFHQKEHRSKGHLFITVLAYQLVQVIRGASVSRGNTPHGRRCGVFCAPATGYRHLSLC